MELQLSVKREGFDPVVVEVEIENFDFIDSRQYREAMFDATMEQVKDELIRAGVL